MALTAGFLLCLALVLAEGFFDPCINHHYIFDTGGRSPVCPYHPDQCDCYITENWYKVVNNGGALEMPTSPVEINRCGATYPLWLNGTYPAEAIGVVNMTVCLSVIGSYCGFSYDIQVKNCGHFYVYYLRKAPGCSHRYCFGTNGVCPTTTTTSTTTPSIAQINTTIGAATQPTPKSTTIGTVRTTTSHFATTLALGIVAAFVIGGAFGVGLSYFMCGRKNQPYRPGSPRVDVIPVAPPPYQNVVGYVKPSHNCIAW